MLKLLSQLLRAPSPSIIEHQDGYAESPFIENISKASLPKKLSLPVLTATYYVLIEPTEHVAQYKQRKWQASIPWHLVEVCMYKSFGATLTWSSLNLGSISNFSILVNKFYDKFEGGCCMDKQTSDLYGVVQGLGESFRNNYNPFNKQMINIKYLDTKKTIECLGKVSSFGRSCTIF